MGELSAELMKVTPSQAKLWLGANNGNRKLRGWWVSALAEAIKRGEWIASHQGIAFTENGRLIDGQHRLSAIVSANIPVEMLVVRGVPENAFKVIDAGVKRSISDLTGLDKKCAQVSRLAASILFPVSFGTTSSQIIIDIANAGIMELHERLMIECPTSCAFYSSSPMRLAAIALVMNGCNEQLVFCNYANLVYQRFDLLPPIAHSLIRQVSSKKIRAAESRRVLACGVRVLKEDKNSGVLMRITDADIDAANAMVRSLLKNAISLQEQVA